MKTKLDESGSYGLLRKLRWPNGIKCPYCEQNRATVHTKSTRTPRRRYLCVNCRRTFTDLTGTPFAFSNLPLRTWLLSLRFVRESLTTSELAEALGVKWDTAAYIQRRLSLSPDQRRLICHLRKALEENGSF